ncbi:MAG: hypothetical protein IJ192_06970 [Clostridia bacterium]|nr:hypothetical protein [Clostridia bacterium]
MTAEIGEKAKIDHRVLLGAHRYTICDGIVRSPRAPAAGLSAPQTTGGTYTSPYGAHRAPTPIVYLRFGHIQRADMSEAASLPVATHHTMKGG